LKKNAASIAVGILQVLVGSALILSVTSCSEQQQQQKQQTIAGAATSTPGAQTPLRMGIAPYQEIALLVNEKPLNLEKKYGVSLELITMPWEDILPAVASAGQTIDVGFASLSDYLAKAERLNSKQDDPIIYLYPAWVFHGGGFITFNPEVPEINAKTIKDQAIVKKFLSYKVGVQKNSCCHMLLWKLANDAGIKLPDLKITDTTLNDGLLATENGSLDIAGAGLTQRTEALKRHGRVVLTMDTVGLMDPGGFVCKASLYKKRKKEIDSLVRIWFECTNYVLSDIDHHNATTLAYLKANASTNYTPAEFKSALSQEFIPQSVEEAQTEVVSGNGKYSVAAASDEINKYLRDIGVTKSGFQMPKMITP
jgi:ABC-type nitrate/sulfonate/bicarbonate transport system substrate-binding protein